MKKIIIALCRKYIFATYLLNRILTLMNILPFSKHVADRENTYNSIGLLGKGIEAIDSNDHTFNAYVRLITQYQYKNVIEVGGYDCTRAVALKEWFPDVSVCAVDIEDEYKKNASFQGVDLRYTYDYDSYFREEEGRSIMVASGTLCFFSPEGIQELFQNCYKYNKDVFLFEPSSPLLSLTQSIRRSWYSHYHPHKHLLDSLGYRTPKQHTKLVKRTYNLVMAENFICLHAIHPNNL